MGISEDIQQKKFTSEFSKAVINIFYTSSWLSKKHQDLFRSKNLTTAQFNALRILRGQHPDPATVNLIIERMLDKNSNASRIIDKLECKQLVVRKQCSKDKRAVDVFISDLGLEMLNQMDQELSQLEGALRNLDEKESEELNRLLDKLRSKGVDEVSEA